MTAAGGAAAATVPLLRLDDLEYELPPGLIAQAPAEPRDASRLLVSTGRGGAQVLDDRCFTDLPMLLRPGDVLVRNDTRVFPARALFRKETGGRVELLFLERLSPPFRAAAGGRDDRADRDDRAGEERWEALARGRLRGGERLRSEAGPEEFAVEVGERLGDGRWEVRPAAPVAEPLDVLLDRYGETPLPPYIKAALADPERYQTTYARPRGSAAAPTAGLHFTPALDAALRAAGVTIEHLTLHVGLATFKPVTAERVEDHPLHEEPFVVDAAVWGRIAAARAAGRRVVAVGTTMVRLLEELVRTDVADARDARPAGGDGGGDDAAACEVIRGRTGLFITPGHEFRAVDGLITNFHLPRTSLLALVMAFCGVDETRRSYEHAIAERYRFYSFGDAMLAWGRGAS